MRARVQMSNSKSYLSSGARLVEYVDRNSFDLDKREIATILYTAASLAFARLSEEEADQILVEVQSEVREFVNAMGGSVWN